MMKKTLLLTIVAATMLAPVALAGPRGDRHLPEDPIVILSTDLLEATRSMRFNVERRARGHHRRAAELLYDLDRLERRARHFRRDAVRGISLRHLNRELDGLVLAFDRADRQMRFVRSGRLQRDFNRIDRAMRRLTRDVEFASTRVRPRRDRGVHGSVVLGDRTRNGRYQVRVRF